jgi:hypothetical protein
VAVVFAHHNLSRFRDNNVPRPLEITLETVHLGIERQVGFEQLYSVIAFVNDRYGAIVVDSYS